MQELLNLSNYSREALLIFGVCVGLFIGAFVGAIGITLFHGRNARRFYRDGCRDTDRLWTARIAQDRRDDAPLSHPVPR